MAELGSEPSQHRVRVPWFRARLFWPPAARCCSAPRTEDSQNLAVYFRQVTLTNWVKMSDAWWAVKGSAGCLHGNEGPKEVSFSLCPAHSCRTVDCSMIEMPLSTSGLLVLAAPDGCPQGSLQLSINIKPSISKGGPDDAQVCGSRVILP